MMDYEKAYKAVLQTAKQWIKDGCTDKEKICLECVFPELRETQVTTKKKAKQKDVEAAILAVGRSRSCINCEAQTTQFCKICYRESVKSFLKGIKYERKTKEGGK